MTVRGARCLVITGMHRSGTSMVSEAFFRAGLDVGDDLIAPDGANARGYFEDRAFVDLQERILAANGTTSNTPRSFGTVVIPAPCVEEADRLIAEREARGRPWGWKDPRTALFLEFWTERLPGARWIFPIRRPGEVAWSLVRRGDFGGRTGLAQARAALALWTDYNARVAAFVARHPERSLVVAVPDDITPEGQERIDRVVREVWGLDLAPVDLVGTRSPRLMRHRTPWWIGAVAAADPRARSLWRGLAASRGVPPPAAGASRDSAPRRGAAGGNGAGTATDLAVCVVSPFHRRYHETIVQAHVERLPARVELLHGGYLPRIGPDNAPLEPLAWRAVRKAAEAGPIGPARAVAPRITEAAIEAFLRRKRITAVLAEHGPTGAAMLGPCARTGVPLLVHFHGDDVWDERITSAWGDRYRRLFAGPARLLVAAPGVGRRLAELGASPDRIDHAPPGVDVRLFGGAAPGAGEPVFVTTGRFVEKHAPHVALLAFRRVADAVPHARLVMLGDGHLRASCEHLARALGIGDRVAFPGAVSQAEVARTLRTARGFVQHAVRVPQGGEGSAVALLEAMAAGVPVVAARNADTGALIEDCVSGFLVPEWDVEALAARMTLLAREPGLAAAVGAAPSARVRAEYAVERSVETVAGLIRAVTRPERGAATAPSQPAWS